MRQSRQTACAHGLLTGALHFVALQEIAQHCSEYHYGHQYPLHLGSSADGVVLREVVPTKAAPAKISRAPVHRWPVTVSCRNTFPRNTAITYPTEVTGRTKLRSARLSSAMRVSKARINAIIPIATNGFSMACR